MRRSLVVSLALLAMVKSPAVAQTCQGLASFTNGKMQVSGHGQFTEGLNRFGAGVAYGLPANVYGGVQLSTSSYDAADASSLGIGANVGYQLTMGQRGNIQVCPVAGFEFGMGPDSDSTAAGPAANRSINHGDLGFSLGTVMGTNPRMQIVPAAGLGLRYSKQKEEIGGVTSAVSDTYGMARLGVGLIFNQQIAVRPSVDIPLGLDGSDPTFGLTVAYSFGNRPAPARRR